MDSHTTTDRNGNEVWTCAYDDCDRRSTQAVDLGLEGHICVCDVCAREMGRRQQLDAFADV